MDLINTTALAAQLAVGADDSFGGARLGCLSVKATFRVMPDGSLEVESESPHPLLIEDTPTPLGILPSDLPIRRGATFEVMMLGAAYAPARHPVARMRVSLSIGRRRLHIDVVGDRYWRTTTNQAAELSAPRPFLRMPLTWERTFGGTAEVWISSGSATLISHQLNPRGRGFDPSADIARLSGQLFVDDDYPRTDYVRIAPNLEHPDHSVTGPDAEPSPWCFSPVPADCGLNAARLAESFTLPPNERPHLTETVGLRAVSALLFDQAPLGEQVTVSGCLPDGADWHFTIPRAVPIMDYVLGDRSGSRELVPQTMVLLPEERRFYIVYRHVFLMEPQEGEERSLRLRFD